MPQVRVNKRENKNDVTDIFGLMLTLSNRVLDVLPQEYLVQFFSEIRIIRIFHHDWGNFQIYGVQITKNAFVSQILTMPPLPVAENPTVSYHHISGRGKLLIPQASLFWKSFSPSWKREIWTAWIIFSFYLSETIH